jgi:nitric oxide synthase oxygenase domain/subunit
MTELRHVNTEEYDQAILKLHFDMICNQKNWKYPIDCLIPTDKFDIFNQAVIHFTGGELRKIASTGTYARCEANGYYIDCGA